MEIEQIENGIKVTIPKKENYTMKDLEQKLINFLYVNIGCLNKYEVEIKLLDLIRK